MSHIDDMMTKNERVKRLCYEICLFLFILFVSRKLNQVAFILAFHRVELYTLLIMIQWIIPVTVFILLKREGERIADIGFVKGEYIKQAIVGLLVGAFSISILSIIPDLIFGRPVIREEIQINIGGIIYYIIGVAAAEEILFRGYILKKLEYINKSKVFCAVISSAVFGLFHIFNKNLYQMISAAFFGMIVCAFKQNVKWCTLLSLIIAHGVHGVWGIHFTSF